MTTPLIDVRTVPKMSRPIVHNGEICGWDILIFNNTKVKFKETLKGNIIFNHASGTIYKITPTAKIIGDTFDIPLEIESGATRYVTIEIKIFENSANGSITLLLDAPITAFKGCLSNIITVLNNSWIPPIILPDRPSVDWDIGRLLPECTSVPPEKPSMKPPCTSIKVKKKI